MTVPDFPDFRDVTLSDYIRIRLLRHLIDNDVERTTADVDQLVAAFIDGPLEAALADYAAGLA